LWTDLTANERAFASAKISDATTVIVVARNRSATGALHQQALDFPPQRFVVFALGGHERGALVRILVERGVAEVLVRRRRSASVMVVPLRARKQPEFCRRQSRLTVSAETSSTSAVSFTLKPPKNLNSTIRLFRASAAQCL
jgi:hypothetical protein